MNEQSDALRYQSFNGFRHLLLFDGLIEEADVVAKTPAANLTIIYMLLWDFLRDTAQDTSKANNTAEKYPRISPVLLSHSQIELTRAF